MLKRSFAFALILAFSVPAFAQAPEKRNEQEEAEKLRKEAVAFLRETMSDVANLRTLENRISFSAEMAGLMWYHDEREARAMFNSSIVDFRELMSRLEQQMNQLPEGDDEAAIMGGFLGGGMSDQARLMMKYAVAMGVRQQITTSIAEHDPDLALGFYYDTASTHPRLQNAYGARDTYFESGLISQIAEKSPAKAAQFGIKSLEKGFNFQHVDLLRKIYEKDQEKGIEFGGRILDKIRTPEKATAGDFAIRNLLSYGIETLHSARKKPGQKPVFTEAQLREVAESYASYMLRPSEKFDSSSALSFASTIESIAPLRAEQLRKRYRSSGISNDNTAGPPPPSRLRRDRASNVYTASNGELEDAEFAAIAPPPPDEIGKAEQQLENEVKSLSKGQLPKEERDRVVAQARKILAQTKGRDKQIMGLSMLAAQVARAGDKELAAEIMRDADRLVNPSPRNYQDFLYTWMLASGYAEADPDKAFPILEDAIARANAVISAFVQVGEFIDVTEQMISDGEAQVGAFGGGMVRGLSRELGIAESTIDRLVKADFAKTKALTNRFERPEVRVLAKMLVLRAVLGKKAPVASVEEQIKAVGQN